MKPAAPATMTATLTLAVLTAVALTGCSSARSDASTPRRSARTPSPAHSLSVRATAEHDALTAYRDMWRAFVQAGRTANASDPMLSRYAEGAALDTITTALKQSRASGQVIKGAVSLQPRVSKSIPASRPSEVDIKDCVDATSWLVYHKNGGLVDNKPGGKHLVVALATNVHGTWRVSALAVHGVGTCT